MLSLPEGIFLRSQLGRSLFGISCRCFARHPLWIPQDSEHGIPWTLIDPLIGVMFDIPNQHTNGCLPSRSVLSWTAKAAKVLRWHCRTFKASAKREPAGPASSSWNALTWNSMESFQDQHLFQSESFLGGEWQWTNHFCWMDLGFLDLAQEASKVCCYLLKSSRRHRFSIGLVFHGWPLQLWNEMKSHTLAIWNHH